MSDLEPTIPLLAFAAVPLVWWGILKLSAWISGWRMLADAYPARSDFTGAERTMQSAGMEGPGFLPANYSGVLTIGANYEGVLFSIFIVFRIGHAPFFIPYNDLRGEESSQFYIPYVRLTASKTPDIAIRIGRPLARWIEEQSGGVWTYNRISQEQV